MSMRRRTRTIWLWTLAILLTLAAVVFQRLIGPTRPVHGAGTLGDQHISYTLHRSHGGPDDHQISIAVPDDRFHGTVAYRRYPTEEPWTQIEMRREDGHLVADLPHQPPGAKLLYQIDLTFEESLAGATGGGQVTTSMSLSGPITIRFRGAVPTTILLPHVLLMFLAMLWSNRAGMEALRRDSDLRRLASWALGLMTLGGLVFGPLVQWHAFGDFWTGFPVGHDLTDSKTLIATVVWLGAVIACWRRHRTARGLVIAAAIVTLVIFSIPHSELGTELDPSQIPASLPPAGS